jgi:deoxyribonuclease-4
VSENRERLRIGPAGNSESFYASGHTKTVDTFAWQKKLFDLDAFEVPFGRGISMSDAAAYQIGLAAETEDVHLSVHAPYYINLANPDPILTDKSINYILECSRLLILMGGERVVVHTGSPKGQSRETAMQVSAERLLAVRKLMVENGYESIRLCLETMGRPSVIGSLDEILFLVNLDASFLPCIDFAHLHACGNGRLNHPADFEQVLDTVEAALGLERARQMHMHFSRIEFGKKGEIRHRTLADTNNGPEFSQLAPLLSKRNYHGTLICESRGTMAEDAYSMKMMFRSMPSQ